MCFKSRPLLQQYTDISIIAKLPDFIPGNEMKHWPRISGTLAQQMFHWSTQQPIHGTYQQWFTGIIFAATTPCQAVQSCCSCCWVRSVLFCERACCFWPRTHDIIFWKAWIPQHKPSNPAFSPNCSSIVNTVAHFQAKPSKVKSGTPLCKPFAGYLGVIFDTYINSVVASCFFQDLSKVKPSLSFTRKWCTVGSFWFD